MSVAFKSAIDDAVIEELRAIIGDDSRVLPDTSSRVFRSRVPAPFPVHRWADHMPDVADPAEDRAGGERGRQARQPPEDPDRPARRRHRALPTAPCRSAAASSSTAS